MPALRPSTVNIRVHGTNDVILTMEPFFSLCLLITKCRRIKGTEVNIHVFQILTLDGDEGSTVSSYRLLHVQGPSSLLERMSVASGQVRFNYFAFVHRFGNTCNISFLMYRHENGHKWPKHVGGILYVPGC